MLKKIAFLIFSLGLGTSYAFAGLDYDLCVDSCEASWESCRQIPRLPGSNYCAIELRQCRAICAVSYP